MQFNSEKLKEINFVKLIKESIVFAWQKKYLWWFGFFIALGSFGSLTFPSETEDSEENSEVFEKISYFISNHQTLFISIVVALLILFVLFFILSILGRGALIKTTYLELEVGKFNFKKGLNFGKKFFWRILTLFILAFFSIFGIILIMAVPIFFFIVSKLIIPAILLGILAILILIPILLLTYFLLGYGQLFLVLGNLSIKQSLENAYGLLQKNLASSLVLLFAFLIVGISFFICTIIVFIPLMIIFVLLGFLFYYFLKTTGLIIIISIAILIFLIIFFIIRSFYEVFRQVVWIKFFQIIAKPKAKQETTSKILEQKLQPTPNIAE